MGKRYVPHDPLCGCERCARQADSEHPRPVYDVMDDDDYDDYGSLLSENELDDYDFDEDGDHDDDD